MRKITIEEVDGGYNICRLESDVQIIPDFPGVVDYIVKYFGHDDPDNYKFADEDKQF